jgi:hypothetical protein
MTLNYTRRADGTFSKFSTTKNHNYFFNWENDPNVLYWAGFLMADGCIFNNTLHLALAEKDKYHLELFQNTLGNSNKLVRNISHNSKRNPNWKDSICYHLSLTSVEIVRDLSHLGIEKQKTFTSIFPEHIKSSKYVSHYCRGYFDGDGGFSHHMTKTRKQKTPQLVVGIRGTEPFLRSFNELLVVYAGLPERCLTKTINKSANIGHLLYVGNNISLQIARWLYSNMDEKSAFLQRKYDIVKDLL